MTGSDRISGVLPKHDNGQDNCFLKLSAVTNMKLNSLFYEEINSLFKALIVIHP